MIQRNYENWQVTRGTSASRARRVAAAATFTPDMHRVTYHLPIGNVKSRYAPRHRALNSQVARGILGEPKRRAAADLNRVTYHVTCRLATFTPDMHRSPRSQLAGVNATNVADWQVAWGISASRARRAIASNEGNSS